MDKAMGGKTRKVNAGMVLPMLVFPNAYSIQPLWEGWMVGHNN